MIVAPPPLADNTPSSFTNVVFPSGLIPPSVSVDAIGRVYVLEPSSVPSSSIVIVVHSAFTTPVLSVVATLGLISEPVYVNDPSDDSPSLETTSCSDSVM